MKAFITLVAVCVFLAVHAGAETYTWTDDKGSFNFTDDLSNVPRKYRATVKRSSEADAPPKEPVIQEKGSVPPATDRAVAIEKTDGIAQEGVREYQGKTLDAWRAELGQKEDELKRMRHQLEMIKDALKGPDVEERLRLTNEYNRLGEEFNQKFSDYSATVEAVRKAFEPKGQKK
jgi:hypothetical protein